MKKPDGLKRLLLQAVPALKASPETLSMFVDKGRVAAIGTGSLSFAYRYTLNLVVQDYAGDLDALFIPLLAWIAEQQPDLLDRGEQEPFAFESEYLDSGALDLSIDIELSERVRVDPLGEGKLKPVHLEDTRPEDAFPGVCGATLWQALFADGSGTIVATPDP